MCSYRHHLSKEEIVIILSPELVGKSVIGFIDLNELSMSSFIIGIVFGVVLQSKFSICNLDVIKSSVSIYTKHFVVVAKRVGEMLIEELLLLFIDNAVLIEESVKGWSGILERVRFAE